MNENSPLVSVVIITYNSQDTIIETLESVKAQTYKNIELIVSDDCSTDGVTIPIIKKWMDENSDCFVRTLLVETPINTGVAPNVNRGIREAKGVWIKGVSGDDKLLPNSIADYVDFVKDNPQCNICFGKLYFWGEDEEAVKRSRIYYEQTYYPYLKADYKVQWRRIQETLFVPGPGLFYKKSLWEKVGGLDERFPFADEYPFTYNILESGERIYFLDKEVYGYQIREGSLCRDVYGKNIRVFNDQYNFIKKVHVKKVVKYGHPFLALHILIFYYQSSLVYLKVPKYVRKLTWGLYLFSPSSYKFLIHSVKARLVKSSL